MNRSCYNVRLRSDAIPVRFKKFPQHLKKVIITTYVSKGFETKIDETFKALNYVLKTQMQFFYNTA